MQTLKGVILSYTDTCSPKFRVFKTMEELERFVGRFLMKNHRSEDHWIDSITNGLLTVVDDSVEIEYNEGL